MEQLLLFIMLGIIYFVPSMVASGKKGSNGILILNIFLGWTGIGWVAALIWAVTAENRPIKRHYVATVDYCPYCNLLTRTTQDNRCVECGGLKDLK